MGEPVGGRRRRNGEPLGGGGERPKALYAKDQNLTATEREIGYARKPMGGNAGTCAIILALSPDVKEGPMYFCRTPNE